MLASRWVSSARPSATATARAAGLRYASTPMSPPGPSWTARVGPVHLVQLLARRRRPVPEVQWERAADVPHRLSGQHVADPEGDPQREGRAALGGFDRHVLRVSESERDIPHRAGRLYALD